MSFDNSNYSDIVECGQPLGSKTVGKQGKRYRKGISLIESVHLLADADTAALWMERARLGDGPIVCPKCGSERGTRTNKADMPYRCKDCRKFFSVKTGMPMAELKLPVTSWLIVAYQLDFVQKSLPFTPRIYRLRRLLPGLAQRVEGSLGSPRYLAMVLGRITVLPKLAILESIIINGAFCKTQANSSPDTASLYDDWILDSTLRDSFRFVAEFRHDSTKMPFKPSKRVQISTFQACLYSLHSLHCAGCLMVV